MGYGVKGWGVEPKGVSRLSRGGASCAASTSTRRHDSFDDSPRLARHNEGLSTGRLVGAVDGEVSFEHAVVTEPGRFSARQLAITPDGDAGVELGVALTLAASVLHDRRALFV